MLCKFLRVTICLFLPWGAAPISAPGEELQDLRGEPVNRFPARISAEAFGGESTTVSGTFKFYLPVDDQRYVPVSRTLARLLSSPPEVHADPPLSITVSKSLCTPQEIHMRKKGALVTVEGALMQWSIKVEAPKGSGVQPGRREVVLGFDAIRNAWRLGGEA